MSAQSSAEIFLPDSRLWHRARLLHPGQQVWAFQSSYQQYSDRFGASGDLQPLGQSYARRLTWKEMLAADTSGRAEMNDYMKKAGVNENDIAATAAYKVSRQETTLAGNWAYGLTSRWMVGFQLPLTYRQTRVTTDVSLNPTLALGTANPVGQKGIMGLSQSNLRKKIATMADQQLRESGYDAVPEQRNSWDLGDVSLLSQVAVVESYSWTWSMQQMVRLPIARSESLADFVQNSTDDGQVDVGVTSLLDYRQRKWISGLRLGYVAQLPDSVRMHVPSDPREIDPSVHRDLGDYGWGALDLERRVSRRFSLELEYTYLKKAADRFAGQSVDGTEYGSLGAGTEQELHQTRAGMQFRLGETSSRSGIENKWVASLGYTYPWIGRNAVDASRTSLELISYF